VGALRVERNPSRTFWLHCRNGEVQFKLAG
jgi:hypothetical protein